MSREFNLDNDGCSIWWLNVSNESKDLREIKNDLNALNMANNVDSTKEMYVCVRIANDGSGHGVDLVGIVLAMIMMLDKDGRRK